MLVVIVNEIYGISGAFDVVIESCDDAKEAQMIVTDFRNNEANGMLVRRAWLVTGVLNLRYDPDTEEMIVAGGIDLGRWPG